MQLDSYNLQAAERALIERALTETRGVVRDAVPLLGISRQRIGYRCRKHGIDPESFAVYPTIEPPKSET